MQVTVQREIGSLLDVPTLIRWFETGPSYPEKYELYNLRDDLGETKNLAPNMTAKVKDLDGLIDAFLEGAAGASRIAQRRDGAGQRETKGGGAEERPAAKFQRRQKPQFGSFPQAP